MFGPLPKSSSPAGNICRDSAPLFIITIQSPAAAVGSVMVSFGFVTVDISLIDEVKAWFPCACVVEAVIPAVVPVRIGPAKYDGAVPSE